MFARIWRYIEGPMLLIVPLCMGIMLYLGIAQAALLMLAMVVLVLAMFFAGYEASRPALRQIMPTLVLAALAAAGRILFGPIPDFKPVSAIAIIAGACLGARSGFMVGALAALTSNFFLVRACGRHGRCTPGAWWATWADCSPAPEPLGVQMAVFACRRYLHMAPLRGCCTA